jgi:predicted RNA polymerase sigma factor
MQEAFAAALSLWPRSGVPNNPRPFAMRDGPKGGLARIDAVLAHGELAKLLPGAFSAGRYVRQARQDS